MSMALQVVPAEAALEIMVLEVQALADKGMLAEAAVMALLIIHLVAEAAQVGLELTLIMQSAAVQVGLETRHHFLGR